MFEVSTALMLWCHRTSKTSQHQQLVSKGERSFKTSGNNSPFTQRNKPFVKITYYFSTTK